jgi:hypothetical protein
VSGKLLLQSKCGAAADATRKKIGMIRQKMFLETCQISELSIAMRTRSKPDGGAVRAARFGSHVSVLLGGPMSLKKKEMKKKK